MCCVCCLQEDLQILITLRQQLVLTVGSIALTSASFIVFRGGLSQMDETRLCAWLCLLYRTSICHPADRLNHCWKSAVLLSSPILASGTPKKKRRVSTCLLPRFIISLVRWRWSRCRRTWLGLHDHLRCKITGLTPREGLNAPLPLLLLCRPLRCLTSVADSIITAVWEGIKRDVACSFSHLLNIQLHCMGHLERRALLLSVKLTIMQSYWPRKPWQRLLILSIFSNILKSERFLMDVSLKKQSWEE